MEGGHIQVCDEINDSHCPGHQLRGGGRRGQTEKVGLLKTNKLSQKSNSAATMYAVDTEVHVCLGSDPSKKQSLAHEKISHHRPS